MSDEPTSPPVAQVKKADRRGTYCGPVESLRGEEATVRTSTLQEGVLIAKFKNPKAKVEDREIGVNWHPLLAADFTYPDDDSEPS